METRPIKIDVLGSMVLCERHNASLSALDDVGGAFAGFIKNSPVHAGDSVINGCDLERWLLKLFLGHSVVSYRQQRRVKNWQPPVELLDALFNACPLEKNCGLYACAIEGVGRPPEFGLSYATDRSTGEGIGVFVTIEGLMLFFAAHPPDSLVLGPNLQLHFHPASLVISERFSTRTMHTGWYRGGKWIYPKEIKRSE